MIVKRLLKLKLIHLEKIQRVGEFVHSFGDLHIYENHMDQVKLQLSRSPLALPTLWLNPEVKNIDDFKLEDIRLDGYESHPAIKGAVAV